VTIELTDLCVKRIFNYVKLYGSVMIWYGSGGQHVYI